MVEFKNRKNTRLKYFDYPQYGYYFITICIRQRKEFFSKVIDGKIYLSKYGEIINSIWCNLDKFYKVELDEYVIMPDHIHGIILINGDSNKQDNNSSDDSLSQIIGKFKSFASRKIRECLSSNQKFDWQKSFYNRIIRNENELYLIRKCIQENPLKWKIEKNNPENLEM